jgi:hypothetical protein
MKIHVDSDDCDCGRCEPAAPMVPMTAGALVSGNPDDPRGRAEHYTGFSREECLSARLLAHWDGTCGVRLVMAFRAAGIPFAVVSIEKNVTRARENQLKLRGAAWRCPIHQGRARAAGCCPDCAGNIAAC